MTQISAAQNMDFVQIDHIKIASITTNAQIAPLSPSQKQTTIVYIDGLGRPLQAVAEQASPLQHDMIQPVAYDNLGRQTISYLPYTDESTNATGSYRANAITTDQPAFYSNSSQYIIATDQSPYTQQVFENSPLQRLLQAGMVGIGFQPGVANNHFKTISYRSNTNADGNILIWNPDGTFTAGTYYNANSLSVTDGKDEDNVETLSFTDLEGHTILKRQILTSGNLDTYYIYNAAGIISYIIPPAATTALSANSYNLTIAPLSNLVFHFTYDTMGRLISKTVPAKGTINIVYDPLSRPVLMQDANMLAANQWNYIKYDIKGRAVEQGIYTDNTTSHIGQANMQTYVNTLSYATIWCETRTGSSTTINNGYYTNAVFPTTNIAPLAYAYFDDYALDNNTSTPDFNYKTQNDTYLPNEESATLAQLRGMPTVVSKTTVGAGSTNTWLTTVTFYDKRLNVIQVQSNNQLYYTNATTLTDTKTAVADFTGATISAKVVKQTTSASTTTVYTYMSYDHMYRVTGISQKYNTNATTNVASYTYNELGQIITKNLGQIASGTIPANVSLSAYSATTVIASSSITLTPGFTVPSGSTLNAFISTGYLQTVDMRYNIRGQLLSINNSKLSNDNGVTNGDNTDLFGMQMLYDQVDANIGNTASFDGKLTAVKWMSKDGSGNSSYERAVKYTYDGINRYTASNYAERTTAGTGAFNNNIGGFDESGITYDAGGNILTLNRNSSTQGTNTNVQIDALAYTYYPANPNQLKTVVDGTGANYTGAGFRNYTTSTGSYTYDANGNLTIDPYKGLNITYDYLNRTDKITFTTATGRYINYTYDATGILIRKQQYDNNILQTTTDYIDGFVYLTAGTGAAALSYFPMPEGRVLNIGSGGTVTLKQEFVITDQQGNARISFQDNGNGTPVVKQESSYYGFGMIMPNSPVATPTMDNKHLYNGGSEWQNDYGNLPDYYQTFNRNYDAAIGRFVGVDPEAESAESMTSYQYAGNNPVVMNDPLGNCITNGSGGCVVHLPAPPPSPSVYSNSPAQGSSAWFSNAWAAADGWIANNLLADAQAGDPVALQQYAQKYGTPLTWNPQGGGRVDNVDDWVAMGGDRSLYDNAIAKGYGVTLYAGAWVANQGGPDMKPAYPGAYTNAAGQILYNDGVVENWTGQNKDRVDAVFIKRNGDRIDLPGVRVSPMNSMKGRGYTIVGGGSGYIYLDPFRAGLEDIEHEYGHYLDYLSRGSLYYDLIVMPFSGINAAYSDQHQNYWTEIRADQLSVQFFGPNSAIAKSTLYPH